MNLHIELDSDHPAYEWLETQADKIGAKGHFGTHIDCYTLIPDRSSYQLSTFIVDCRKGMPTIGEVLSLPVLEGKALILHTGNMYKNDYGQTLYFEADTVLSDDVLTVILSKKPRFILIDSYGIGTHGKDHIAKDKRCESSGCFVIENICIHPDVADRIGEVRIEFDLEYPSTGKPCKIY